MNKKNCHPCTKDQDISKSHSNTSLTLKKVHLAISLFSDEEVRHFINLLSCFPLFHNYDKCISSSKGKYLTVHRYLTFKDV